MKICVFGSGYVGLVTGACFAETGNHVVCVDKNEEKIQGLKKGKIPIFEPGLSNLINENLEAGRLIFDVNPVKAIKEAEVIFIAVGTPSDEDGSADLQHVLAVARTIGEHIKEYKTIVLKSTVPVGTAKKVREIISQYSKITDFDVISNPEFLKEGSAIKDFMFPERIVIGHATVRGKEIMAELYRPYMMTNKPILFMDNASAELTKYAANAFLAVKISFMNEIANFCERIDANVDNVRLGMGHDSRIGHQFLFPGVGYGGSCFPKDVKELCAATKQHDIPGRIIMAAEEINRDQKLLMVKKINKYYGDDLKNKTFAIWGLSFKPKTDDMREAPSLTVINELLNCGARVKAYDPEAMAEAKKHIGNKIEYCKKAYEALLNANALIILTEWNEFRSPDFQRIKEQLKDNVIFDGRNIFHLSDMYRHKINYISIGRSEIRV